MNVHFALGYYLYLIITTTGYSHSENKTIKAKGVAKIEEKMSRNYCKQSQGCRSELLHTQKKITDPGSLVIANSTESKVGKIYIKNFYQEST